jgi:A/G-specific adenine glycosylase
MSRETHMTISVVDFQKLVCEFYHQHKRAMPWRHPEPNGYYSPYKIMVSEIMLQQTQVRRVTPKYNQFIACFPSLESLANAPLAEVLKVWSGLGYNRRAQYLWMAAGEIMKQFNGSFPETVEELMRLPGIGRNTAAAICAYAYDQPVVYIETNIRSVYIHHFSPTTIGVADADILDLVRRTLPTSSSRQWYYALMDYGAHLKTIAGNTSRQSRSYKKQTAFHGSLRQLRGAVLRLLATDNLTLRQLSHILNDDRLKLVCTQLLKEGLIHKEKTLYVLG